MSVKSAITVLFSVVICPTHCNDSSQNYFVVEAPPEPRVQKPFTVYWNVPTMQCRSKKLPFDSLVKKFGIVHNENDIFSGENVALLYDPGLFPSILTKDDSKDHYFRNGGVPQEGDLMKHLLALRSDVKKFIPDANFSGVAVIDFEAWRPIFRQNFGVNNPYRNLSMEIEKERHPTWNSSMIMAEAERRFEAAAKEFMLQSLLSARQQRPLAAWGYYGFPYCFNVPPGGQFGRCSKEVGQENDRTDWLWKASDAVYPSMYSLQTYDTEQLRTLVQTRMKEATRAGTRQVVPYFWYRYRDGGFLRERDVKAVLNTLYRMNATGVLIWGSSQDVRTVDQCQKLYEYLNNTLGPIVAKYTNVTEYFDTGTSVTNARENIESPTSMKKTFGHDLDKRVSPNSIEYSSNPANDSLSLSYRYNLVVVKNDEDSDKNEVVIIDEQMEVHLKAFRIKLLHLLDFDPNKAVHDINENRRLVPNLWRNVIFNNDMQAIVNRTSLKLNESHPQRSINKIHYKVPSAINYTSNYSDLTSEKTLKLDDFVKFNIFSPEPITNTTKLINDDVSDYTDLSLKPTLATHPYYSIEHETNISDINNENSMNGWNNERYTQSMQNVENSTDTDHIILQNEFDMSTTEHSIMILDSTEGSSTEMNVNESDFKNTDSTELLPNTTFSYETILEDNSQSTEMYDFMTQVMVSKENAATIDMDILKSTDE